MKKLFLPFCLVGIMLLVACGPSRNLRITNLFEQPVQTEFDFELTERKQPIGVTVGILMPEVYSEAIVGGEKKVYTEIEPSSRPFYEAVNTIIEKALIAQGCGVSGVYNSYKEMTFPERQRSMYLVQLKFSFNTKYDFANLKKLENYAGPKGERYAYASGDSLFQSSGTIEYVIYESLTQQVLEKRKITVPLYKSSTVYIMQGKYVTYGKYGNVTNESYEEPKGSVFKVLGSVLDTTSYIVGASDTMKQGTLVEDWKGLEELPQLGYHEYYNVSNFVNRSYNSLFSMIKDKVAAFVSAEEFQKLKEYKDTLEKKKQY